MIGDIIMIVIVVGMHRSGTSATAGLLHNNGIIMGENQYFNPKPKPNQNPKGFFENRRFRDVNDHILGENGYIVKSFSPIIPEIKTPSLKLQYDMRTLIEEYNNAYQNWGWKDPRICLTLDKWLTVIQEMKLLDKVKIVFVRRDIPSIVKSMMKRRNGKEIQLTNLCKEYFNRLQNAIELFGNGAIKIDFIDLCEKTDYMCNHLSEKLNMLIQNNGFIESGLRHNK